MNDWTNCLTRLLNCAPITTATARSTRFPRRMKFLKPLMRDKLPGSAPPIPAGLAFRAGLQEGRLILLARNGSGPRGCRRPASEVLLPPHPHQGEPAPDRRQVRGKQALDEHGR